MRPLHLVLPALGATLALATPAAAATPPTPVTGAPLLTLVGPGDGGSFGLHVDVVGDLNGDGRDDVAVTDPSHRVGEGFPRGGTAWVVFAPAAPTTVDLRDLRTPEQGFVVRSRYDEMGIGTAVADAGDVNGDGFDDLILGAPGDAGYQHNVAEQGIAAVLYGARIPRDVQLEATYGPGRGFVVDGPDIGARLGTSVAGAGDVNGDGYDDVIVGAPRFDTAGRDDGGAAYVIYGSPVERDRVATRDIDAADGFRVRGVAGSQEGSAVAGVGDLDGDGFDDVATGAPLVSRPGRLFTGVVSVIRGGATNEDVDAAEPLGARGTRVLGGLEDDRLGTTDALAAGDVDGDGLADLVLGTPYRSTPQHTSAGAVTVVPGARLRAGDVDLETATGLGTVTGSSDRTTAGVRVAVVDDLDGDGRAEWLTAEDDPTDEQDSAYLVHGRADAAALDLAELAPADGLRLVGTRGDSFGSGLGSGGDVDGDGRGDLLIGASYATVAADREEDGAAYVVSGELLPRAVFADPVRAREGWATNVPARRWVATGARSVEVTPALPAGLRLDPATGAVSGTATTPGLTSHTVLLRDERGTTRSTLRVFVAAAGSGGAGGAPGEAGPAGSAGSAGAKGADGAAGVTGAPGPAGPLGAAGATGRPGVAGPSAAVAPAAAAPVGLPRVRCARSGAVARCRLQAPRGGTFAPVRLVLTARGRIVATATAQSTGTIALRGRVAQGRYRLRLQLVGDPAVRDIRAVRL